MLDRVEDLFQALGGEIVTITDVDLGSILLRIRGFFASTVGRREFLDAMANLERDLELRLGPDEIVTGG